MAKINLSIPEELLEKLDLKAEQQYRSRNSLILESISNKLGL